MGGTQKKENLNTMERKVYRESPDGTALAKATCIENTSESPVPITDENSKNITIYQIPINALEVNTEIEQTLATNTRRVLVQATGQLGTVKTATIRVAFIENGTLDVGVDSKQYKTVPPGGWLDLDKLNLVNSKLYFQCDKQPRTIEIIEYS